MQTNFSPSIRRALRRSCRADILGLYGLLQGNRATTRSGRITNSEAARRLGVTRTHLSLVLHGHRISKSLSRRYAELKKQFA